MFAAVASRVLESGLRALADFPCPTHHQAYYERTRQALTYLLEPAQRDRIVFLRNSTFAPVCAELVPDSGVAFLRGIPEGPRDLAAQAERAARPAATLVSTLWTQALGLEYSEWRPLADQAPLLFVRLGCSRQNDQGRWEWALLEDEHLEVAFADASSAFQALIGAALAQGDLERASRLVRFQMGVLG